MAFPMSLRCPSPDLLENTHADLRHRKRNRHGNDLQSGQHAGRWRGGAVLCGHGFDSHYCLESTTDAKGHYSVKGLAKGTYNMLAYSAKALAKGTSKLLATNDSLIGYQDSILVLYRYGPCSSRIPLKSRVNHRNSGTSAEP